MDTLQIGYELFVLAKEAQSASHDADKKWYASCQHLWTEPNESWAIHMDKSPRRFLAKAMRAKCRRAWQTYNNWIDSLNASQKKELLDLVQKLWGYQPDSWGEDSFNSQHPTIQGALFEAHAL